MNIPYKNQNEIIVPPGETLKDQLREIGMTQRELAHRINMSTKTVNQIIKGIAPITPKTALKLEYVLDMSPYFLLNLESKYRLALLRQIKPNET